MKKLTFSNSMKTRLRIFGIGAVGLSSMAFAMGLGAYNAKNDKPLVGDKAYAEEASADYITATDTNMVSEDVSNLVDMLADSNTNIEEPVEEALTESTELSAWERQQKAEYYRNMYGPKIKKTVEVDGYTLDYINGAPYSVYQEQARGIKLEEERIAEEERRAEEQRQAEELAAQQEAAQQVAYEAPSYNPPSGGCLTPSSGIYYYGNQLETYYNLDMSVIVDVAHSNGIGGEYWIRDDGCKMLGDYIMLACNRDVHPYGTLVETSLGTGISLDTGGFAAGNPYQVDIAVNW